MVTQTRSRSPFRQGDRTAPDLQAGMHVGTVTEIEERFGQPGQWNEGEAYYIFKGVIEHDGTETRVSAIAPDDLKKTRKLVRWSLALAGKTPEEWPDDGDLTTLPTTGRALFKISYTKRQRDPKTKKFVEVRSEFPVLEDILPLPNGMQEVPF